MNLEVADSDRAIKFFMGSKNGETLFGKGSTDEADLTLSTDIDTAREVFVANNPAAGMQAFMAGKVRIQGDMTKLMMAQAGWLSHEETVDNLTLFSREVLPRLQAYRQPVAKGSAAA